MSNTTDPGRTRLLAGLCLVFILGLLAYFAADIVDLTSASVSDSASASQGDRNTTPTSSEELTDGDADDDVVLPAPKTIGSILALTFAIAAACFVWLTRPVSPPVPPPQTQPTI